MELLELNHDVQINVDGYVTIIQHRQDNRR